MCGAHGTFLSHFVANVDWRWRSWDIVCLIHLIMLQTLTAILYVLRYWHHSVPREWHFLTSSGLEIHSLNYTQIMLILFNSIFPTSNWMWVFVETWKSLRFRVWGLGSFGCWYPNLQVDNSCLLQLVLFNFQCWRKKYGGCCWFCNSLIGLNWSQYCHSTMEWQSS